MPDLNAVPESTGRDHAVVIGGSVAGLCAAAALSGAYRRVTVVDRDALPVSPRARRGAPQGHHVHALLTRGLLSLEELLPGLVAEMVADGAPRGDAHADAKWCLNGYSLCRAESSLRAVSATRPFIEGRVRRRVAALPDVSLRAGVRVTGLVSGRPGVVTGVELQGCNGGDGTWQEPADLVIDASGRGSRLPQWLVAHGYAAPAEESLEVDVGYATRTYRHTRGAMDGLLVTIVGSTPLVPRGGLAQRIEGDRLLVTLTGYRGHHPPADEAGFEEHAASLVLPDIHRIVRECEPLSEVTTYRVRRTSRRRYETLRRFPANLLVLGDAICAFNPVYAQGMSVAAAEAVALRRLVRSGSTPSWRRFFAECAAIVEPAWAMARGSDLRFPQVGGSRPLATRLVGRWMQRIQAVAAEDAVVAATLLSVAHLVAPPSGLFAPRLVARVLRRRLSARADRASTILDPA